MPQSLGPLQFLIILQRDFRYHSWKSPPKFMDFKGPQQRKKSPTKATISVLGKDADLMSEILRTNGEDGEDHLKIRDLPPELLPCNFLMGYILKVDDKPEGRMGPGLSSSFQTKHT